MKGVRVCLPTAAVPTAGKTHTSPDSYRYPRLGACAGAVRSWAAREHHIVVVAKISAAHRRSARLAARQPQPLGRLALLPDEFFSLLHIISSPSTFPPAFACACAARSCFIGVAPAEKGAVCAGQPAVG